MAQIICLANSKKHSDRCIAGIEIVTGKWIRPVSDLDDGRVPRNICLVDDREPRSLEILEIPLASDGPGYECENRSILPGEWSLVRKASLMETVQYLEEEILYSSWSNAVPFSHLQALPEDQRRTLQLIKTAEFSVHQYPDTKKWEGRLSTVNGQTMRAKITDLDLLSKLDQGITPSNVCLVTISLAQPWRRSSQDELSCWKLISGVIEL